MEAEMAEIKKKFGWRNVQVAEKFYGHSRSDEWYYIMYVEEKKMVQKIILQVCYHIDGMA